MWLCAGSLPGCHDLSSFRLIPQPLSLIHLRVPSLHTLFSPLSLNRHGRQKISGRSATADEHVAGGSARPSATSVLRHVTGGSVGTPPTSARRAALGRCRIYHRALAVRRRRIVGRTSPAGHRRLPYAAADKLEEEARRGESCTRR